jgi:hypothetical protein
MFRASLRPSSGEQNYVSLPMVFCPVKGSVVLWQTESYFAIIISVCSLASEWGKRISDRCGVGWGV